MNQIALDLRPSRSLRWHLLCFCFFHISSGVSSILCKYELPRNVCNTIFLCGRQNTWAPLRNFVTSPSILVKPFPWIYNTHTHTHQAYSWKTLTQQIISRSHTVAIVPLLEWCGSPNKRIKSCKNFCWQAAIFNENTCASGLRILTFI